MSKDRIGFFLSPEMAVESVLQAWEACDKVDTVFILVCIVFCWPIIPAVGLGYSGYSTRKSGLASFYPSILAVACCSIQWYVLGYTLAYGEGGGVFGDFKYAFHRGVLSDPVGTIPAILFSEFQLVFEATGRQTHRPSVRWTDRVSFQYASLASAARASVGGSCH